MNKCVKLLCGVSASGKTTYIKENLKNDKVISRDEIRFSFPISEKTYFSYEKEVFNLFIDKINEALKNNFSIVIDATHISKKSRYKVLSKIKERNDIDLEVIVIKTSLNDCLERNKTREGLAKVPDKVIKDMYYNFENPEIEEFNKYNFNNVKITYIHN